MYRAGGLSGDRGQPGRDLSEVWEYAIYCRGKVVALFCDDQLFVKPTLAGKAFIGKITEGSPYPGAKPWLMIAGHLWEDSDWISQLVSLTSNELPLPKPKPVKARRPAKR